jgi:hypothetical protein
MQDWIETHLIGGSIPATSHKDSLSGAVEQGRIAVDHSPQPWVDRADEEKSPGGKQIYRMPFARRD